MIKYLAIIILAASPLLAKTTDEMGQEALKELKEGAIETGKGLVEGALSVECFRHGRIAEGAVTGALAADALRKGGAHLYKAGKIESDKCVQMAEEYRNSKKRK